MSAIMKRELSKQKKMLHPNSRKILAIAKKSKKALNRENAKQTGSMKQNLIREKMLWMREHMVPDVCPYPASLTGELLEKYIARHDEEMAKIVESKLGKKNRSHTSREDVLRMTKEREVEEYNGAGIEIPNILNSAQCEMLRQWDGDLRYLPNFSFRRFGKKHVATA
ncbi:translation machinery-associated protein 16 [Diachasma alloeum]|uniref:translation machinery-associated protein 16 n=1 Tax=Diachasma alloeum TaxID=454923 RepID=UPI0007383785|nr:translation machinery-associated protein 16 [Diachasma alloeum]XP_015120222.1 translation machinery-associated protein 16 [Diachasma alloeum]